MTVATVVTSNQYAGNGATVTFDFDFPVYTAAELVVSDIDATGSAALLDLNTDYTISGVGDADGGTITLTTATASGHTIDIRPVYSLLQTANIRNQTTFRAEIHEGVFDRLTRFSHYLYRLAHQALRLPDVGATQDGELADVDTRKGKYLFFDSVTGAVSYAVNLAVTTLTKLVINSLINERTPAEIAAGIVPTDYNWPEGWAPRYGMVGDDATLNTSAMTTWLELGQQNVRLYLPPGIYQTGQNLIYPGTVISGSGERSVLKLVANSPKSTRMLTTQGAALWNSSVDSPVIHISNIAFDGNRVNQGAYLAFEKEQQHHVLVAANKLSAGRCRMVVESCFFKEGCADGIAVAENADISVSNCTFFNLFRSSISMLGGYSKVRIVNCQGGGDVHTSRMQAEIDTTGFGGVNTATLLMDNCDWDGGLDIALDGGSFVAIDNCVFRSDEQCITNLDGNLTGLITDFTATNCFFKIGSSDSGTHRFFRYGRSKFTNCTFEYTNNTSHTALIQPSTLTNQSITFDNCTFRGDATYHTAATVAGSSATWASGLLTVNTAASHGLAVNDYVRLETWTSDVNGVYRVSSVPDADTITIPFPRDPGAVTVGFGTTQKRSALNALSCSADTRANMNQMHIVNCKFDGSVDCCFDMQQGGWLSMRGNHTDAGLLYDAGASASFVFELHIGQYSHGSLHRQMCHVTGSVAGCLLNHEGTLVAVEKSGFTRSGNLTGLTMRGYRMIYGSGGALSTDPCLMGDIYNRDIPLASTAQQYWALTGAQSGAAASWKAGTTLAA